MKLIFIRHGETIGNKYKRYIGKTDEQLSESGIEKIREKKYPECGIVIVSPMKRCKQTADIIYPHKKKIICENLRECDFGDFEGKNYMELKDNNEYQKWIDSDGKLPFPNGESPENFKKRCIKAFEDMVSEINQTAAFIVHGGTIMAIFEKYAVPHKNYYDYAIGNGEYFITEFNGKIKIIGD